jgi:hypothetical protein
MNHQAYRLYPNPAGEFITLEMFENHEDFTFSIYCLIGQLISETNLRNKKNHIQTSHLPAGVYQYIILKNKEMLGAGLMMKE